MMPAAVVASAKAPALELELRAPRKHRSTIGSVAHTLRQRPLALVGIGIVLTWLALGLLAPVLPIADPDAQNLLDRLQPPSATHPLGTDDLGRDILSRIVWGARVSVPAGDSESGTSGITVVAVKRALDDDGITDDELTALALAADPDQPVGPDAVPIWLSPAATSGLLPEWYMPAPMSAGAGRARRLLLGGVVLILVVINGAGLCVTYGVPEIAW